MELKPIDDEQLFFENSEKALGVFGSKKWLSIYGNDLKLVGIYREDGQLLGGFFYFQIKKYGFNFTKLPPYSPHCGLFYLSTSKNKAAFNSFRKEIITEVCDYIKNLNSTLTVLAFPNEVIDLQPFIWNKFKVVPNYTYQIKLNQDSENIRNNFDPKNRNAISKALKEEVILKENTLNGESLFDFFSKSLKSVGANVYLNELRNIFLEFSDSKNSFHYSAHKNNELLGVVFCIYDQSNCYYLLGGQSPKNTIQGVSNLLIQQCIEKAKSLNCLIFDFEGSMLKGVEKFFRGFGADLVPYYTINKAALAIEVILKFKKRELF